MLSESFIAQSPEEAYRLAIQKYGSIDNFKIIKATQYKNRDSELVSEITIEVDESAYLESCGIDEEEALIEEMNLLKSKMDKMREALSPKKSLENEDLEKRALERKDLEEKELPKDKEIEQIKELLINRGLSRNWVENMLNPFIGTQVAQDKSLLLSFVLEEIEEAIEITKKSIDSRINILVGTTGVGKTTTVAKLTGWSALKGVNPDDIALINLDNYRVGAQEQLGFYAKSMGVDYYCPSTADDLKNVINSLTFKKLIFIDTAGSSPYDSQKLLDTVEYCKSIDNSLKTLSATLVVSVTSKYEDLKDIYEHFSFLNIDSVIATKFDETKNVGNLIAFLLDTKLPVSFLSIGQEVPIDLEIATKRRILETFIGEIDDK